MRIPTNLVSRFMLCALLLPIGGISAMEYGDMPMPVGTVHTTASWLYSKITGSQATMDQVEPVAPVSTRVASVVFSAPTVPVKEVVQSSYLTITKPVALVIAGGAVTLWAAKKIYEYVNTKTKNGE